MKLLQSICLLLFVSLSLSLQAQIKDDIEDTAPTQTVIKKNFFHTLGMSLLFDYYIPPAVKWYSVVDNGVGGVDSTLYYYRNFGFNLVSVTYDARINFHDFNDYSSVSVNVPIAFGFGPTEPGGVMSLSFPILCNYNYGCHSTYNNIDKIGFNIGIGCDLMVTPVIRTERWREINRFWYAPMARIGIIGPYKRHNGFCTVQMSLPEKYYDDSEGRSYMQRVHFKIVLGKLLRYD